METFSVTQRQRLTELNADEELAGQEFESREDRNKSFKELEKNLVKRSKLKLKELMHETHTPLTLKIENDLSNWLTDEEGFTRVETPIIIPYEKLEKMNIYEDHHLWQQIFKVDKTKALRPMLAPNLYDVMRELHRISKEPVKIFEIGSCFRRESQGAQHMNEFTMLNLVELAGVEDGKQMEKLEYFAHSAMKAVGIDKYTLEKESSGIYIETLDIMADGVEIASGSFGPHSLDANWGIFDTWVGIGLGIERIAMVKGEYQTIKRAGKSISYVDGIPLKL